MRGRAALAAALLLAGCAAGRPPAAGHPGLAAEAGQLLLVGFHGTEPGEPELERLLCETRVGGVVIFARNVVDADQVARLTGGMQEQSRACTERPLLVAADAEGGDIMRLGPAAGYTPTLPAAALGAGNDLAVTELEARRIGAMLRAAGINWNLAPVVDVGYNPANPTIVGRGRAFGASPALVTAHARAFIAGMRAEGVLTALKHFPGHGSSFADSHVGFVDVTDTARRDVELSPYRVLLAERAVDAVMTAHVVNRHVDPDRPATLSRATIGGVLRGELGWDGLVVTDDLRMAAIERRYGLAEAAVLALQAGADLLLIADDRLPGGGSAAAVALAAIRRALAEGRLDPERVAAALHRVKAFKARLPEDAAASR